MLSAATAVDELRKNLKDGLDGSPPQLREDILKLHDLAMAVFNEGSRSHVADLFELAVDLDDRFFELMSTLKQVQGTISSLTALYPDSLSYTEY